MNFFLKKVRILFGQFKINVDICNVKTCYEMILKLNEQKLLRL